MSAAQILRQAETLKSAVADTSRGANEAWVSRQTLQDLYQKILVLDLEYALDKKVEQDLWNHAFKNQINTLQTQAKDKQNPKRGEIQSSLNLFLETASGFYLQLLQEICSAFKLDLPFRRKSSNIGILKEYGPVINKVKVPKKSSCMYICQHCLVHMGDIARYRQQIEQAQTYYRHAALLVPYNGQPYNQLAILEAAKGNKLSTVFYYIRSIAVKHPFPVASTNLEKLYNKLSKDSLEHRGKLSMSEIIATFLQFHAFVHLGIEMKKAKSHGEKLINSLPTHITSMSFSSYQLVQMVAINLFALDHALRKLDTENNKEEMKESMSQDELQCHEMVFQLTVSILENLLHHTPKQEAKAKEYHTLPVIKVLFDWLHTDRDLVTRDTFKNSSVWPNLSKLLNNLQFHNGQKDISWELEKYSAVPLPEDCDLQCFVPIVKAYSDFDFHLMPCDGLSSELELRLRCHRMVEHGLWICEEFPSLNLLNVQKAKSGRLQFIAPAAHVRLLPNSESVNIPEKKSYRQNVAIQAIMQNRARKEKGQETNTVSEQRNITSSDQQSHTESQRTSPPTVTDAGVSTHESNAKKPDLGNLSGCESGSDSTKSDPESISPSQQKSPLAHGMYQIPSGIHSFLTQPEGQTEPMMNKGQHPGPQQTNFTPYKILTQSPELARQNIQQSGDFCGDPDSTSIHPEIRKIHPPKPFPSTINQSLASHLGSLGIGRDGDGPPSYVGGGRPVNTQPGPSHMPQMNQIPPPGQMKVPAPHLNPMSPTFQQLQQIATQQFLAQQAQQLQARQNQTGGPAGSSMMPVPRVGPIQDGPRQSSQMRLPSGNQNPLGMNPHGFNSSPFTNPGQLGIIGQTSGGGGPQMRHPTGFGQGDLVTGFGNIGGHSREPPSHLKHEHPNQPRLPLPVSASNPGTIGQPIRPPPMVSEIEAAQRLTPGAGPLMAQNSPFFPIPSQFDEKRELTNLARSSLVGDLPSDSLLPRFSVSPGINVSFNPIAEAPPKPDSPPTHQIGGRPPTGDMFLLHAEGTVEGPPTSAPYMLFSQSPWSVGMMNKSESSSPFGSSNSSVRTTPDPFNVEDRPGINISLGYNFGPSPASDHPWNSQSSLSSSGSNEPVPVVDQRNQRPPSNMQALWSSHTGPSPLEKLLEQQKHQRMGDPH